MLIRRMICLLLSLIVHAVFWDIFGIREIRLKHDVLYIETVCYAPINSVHTDRTENADASRATEKQAQLAAVKNQKTSLVGSASQKETYSIANEAGQDQLKHGAEARFMHGLATEEFVEDNYIGDFDLCGSVVRIIDDRKRSGHLILQDTRTGFSRELYRFNRFIYIYGPDSSSPEPIEGSVTFFSDGRIIHQFIWEYNATTAYYPKR